LKLAELPAPRAILFDWDNTLVDNWLAIHDALNATLVAMGHVPWTVEETRDRLRKSLRDSFPEMFGARWEEARDIFYTRFEELHIERLRPLEGASAALERLAASGRFYLAVVSNKTGPYLRAEAAALGWDRHFGRLVGATDAAADKPASDPVHMALAGSGIAPGADVWFVGDGAIDVQCALAAGLVPVLLEGPKIREELLRHNVDEFVVENRYIAAVSDLPSLLGLGPAT
jgi:phosphoglycolate phosphatase